MKHFEVQIVHMYEYVERRLLTRHGEWTGEGDRGGGEGGRGKGEGERGVMGITVGNGSRVAQS